MSPTTTCESEGGDLPVAAQFWGWLAALAKFDLWRSVRSSRKPPAPALHAVQQHCGTASTALPLRPGLPVSCLPLRCFPFTHRNNSLSEGTYGMPAVLQHKRTQVGRDRVARQAAGGVPGACHSGPQAWMTSLCCGEASACCIPGRLRLTLAAELCKLYTKHGSRCCCRCCPWVVQGSSLRGGPKPMMMQVGRGGLLLLGGAWRASCLGCVSARVQRLSCCCVNVSSQSLLRRRPPCPTRLTWCHLMPTIRGLQPALLGAGGNCCSTVASLPQRIVVVNRSAAQDDKPERLHDSFSAVDYSGSR